MSNEFDRGRFAELEPLAVVDIGSNSVRLVVYEGAVRTPVPLFNEKVHCGLGRSVASTGRLGNEAIERALEALTRFKSVSRILKVKNIRAIATAAVRDAADGADFIRRGERNLGVKIDVLSGTEEAELAALGVRMGFRSPDGITGDLGGGSLELIDVTDPKGCVPVSLPLGGLRLIDTSGGNLDAALRIADEQLSAVPWLRQVEGRTFFAVGGAWRALARLHMDETDYPLRVMHGYQLPAREALDFCERLRKARKLSDFRGISAVSKARREVLPLGALVLERLIKRMRPKDVVFSVFGIREGLLFNLLGDAERARDPLLSFCEDYARLRSRSAEHARELIQWTDALFRDGGPAESDEERRLRHAGCLISDIGWRAHPDYRGEQSLNVIAHAGLGGIDHPGRVFLALTVFYRHIGLGGEVGDDDALSERMKKIVPRRLIRRARILGGAIRTAHMLSIGMPGIIDETPIGYEKDRLVLKLPRAYASLNGERLQRRLLALAAELEKRPEIEIGA